MASYVGATQLLQRRNVVWVVGGGLPLFAEDLHHLGHALLLQRAELGGGGGGGGNPVSLLARRSVEVERRVAGGDCLADAVADFLELGLGLYSLNKSRSAVTEREYMRDSLER